METLFSQISWWHWLIAALVFFILEIMMPAILFLWFGIAAFVVGMLVLVFSGIPWEVQLTGFSLLGVASAVGWRIYQKNNPTETDQPELNQRGQQYIGEILEVVKAIKNGTGRARVGDSIWKVEGPDMPEGSSVKVVAVEDTTLIVVAVD
ncbi:MAG: NfeD family protein [bacterium]